MDEKNSTNIVACIKGNDKLSLLQEVMERSNFFFLTHLIMYEPDPIFKERHRDFSVRPERSWV